MHSALKAGIKLALPTPTGKYLSLDKGGPELYYRMVCILRYCYFGRRWQLLLPFLPLDPVEGAHWLF